ncbi:DGQHR domain-containing protein [Leadbettera azotonutricia]|uniref:Putative DGQHR domain protein n=1 Tax=Leadbettera azotonutricia (strain ATCC BAA-888 / DSM 13862 / ZAS-9) TaxID=545695 RepID=F5YBT3_LEAAZ|nr:DGQHR domain-containing protein [Leadbettera azotonutricia]AEF81642.1 putative DGQHR domain protein [Leadbettera azotonutricia ZAS-9]
MNTFPAIRILQPLGEFYLTAIPAEYLLKICFSHRHIRHDADEKGHVQDEGHQRRLSILRLNEISRYLETQDATLPGTIIIAANCKEDGTILDPNNGEENVKRWIIAPKEGDDREIVRINIPTTDKLGAVVDGQHRLWGFENVSDELKKILLPCAIFIDLPTPQQAAIFATINFNQKPVNKSQSYELFGYNLDDELEASWSPDKLAVFFARKLNIDNESPFKDHIKVAAQDDRVLEEINKLRQKEWSISTATIVEGILLLITKNAKQDRDILHKYPINSRSRKSLSNIRIHGEPPPFRGIYLAADHDIVIYKTLINFFSAANELFWGKENCGLIRKTAGVQALFRVLRELLPDQLEKNDLQQVTWISILEKAGKLDFSNITLFESSGRGRKRIQDAILVSIGKMSLGDIMDQDFRKYLENMNRGVNNV